MKKSAGRLKRLYKKIADKIKVQSIQFIITVSFACITVLAIIFIGVTFYGKYTTTAEQNAAKSISQVLEQVNLNLVNYQNNMNEILNNLERSISKKPSLPDAKLEEQMDVILNMRDDIVALAIFTDNGELIMGDPFSKLKPKVNVAEQDWFKQTLVTSQSSLFSAPHVENLFEGKHNWVLSLSKPVNFYYKGEMTKGVLLIDLNFSSINQLCQKVSLGKRGYIYIIDLNGNLIYHPQQQLIYAGLKKEESDGVLNNPYGSFTQEINGEKRTVTIRSVGYTEWKIIGISYLDELQAAKKDITSFSWLILFFAIIFVVLVFIFISAKITQPIKHLERSMKKVEEGDFDINVDIKGEAEIVHLSNTFNLMVARIRLLMDQIVFEQEAKRKSELNALQAQINPHFLYNTLDSIVWMAENEKSQDVITMVTALARLFRISISRGKNIITVKEELEHARNYLIIQKVRYKNKFEFQIEAEDGVLQYKTLKLILQPIIENSIYHGIEYMVDEAIIKITANIVDGKLLLEVTDNGLGMKQEVVERLLSYESKGKDGSGVGVKNVHERIQLCFGREYGLNIESELEVGTTVKIWLPLLSDDSQGA